jgi:hypothetical protein
MGGACSAYGGEERCVQRFGGEPERKRPLGRPTHRWEDNIKMYLQIIGWSGMDWIDLTEDRNRWRTVVDAAVNLQVP